MAFPTGEERSREYAPDTRYPRPIQRYTGYQTPMQYAMYCENGHRIDFVDPATGERENRYIGDFHAQLLDADVDGNPYPLPKFCADCGAKTMSKCHGCGAYIQYNDSRVRYVPNYCAK